MNYKTEFLKIAYEITRTGIDDFISYLEKTDFFTAPCSTHYHGSNPMGLVKHSLAVRQCLKEISVNFNWNSDTIDIVSLFHDVCKINCYTEYLKNVKNETTGQWEKVSAYKWNDKKISYGHGEESALILDKFIGLTIEERFAIRYHMGAYMQDDQKALHNVWKKYPIGFYLHMADMQATIFIDDEV